VGAFLDYPFDPQFLAGNNLALLNSPISIFHNPSLLPDSNSLSVCYANPFSLKDLKLIRASYSNRGVSFGVEYFGFSPYREISFIGGRKLKAGELTLGVSFKFLTLFVLEETIKGFSLDAGAYLRPYQFCAFSFYVRNFISSKFFMRRLPVELAISFLLREKESLKGYLDFFFEEGRPMSLRFSQAFSLSSKFFLGMGISTNPETIVLFFSVGSALSYSVRVHKFLGDTHSIMINPLKLTEISKKSII